MANDILVLKGTASWAKVMPGQAEKWDQDNNRFIKADDGQYSITLTLPETDPKAIELCEHLDRLGQEVFDEEVKRKPALKKTLSVQPGYTSEYDEDGNETGNVQFRFKANAMSKDGKKRKLAVVDSKRKPIAASVEVGNGSTVKVAFSPMARHVSAQKKIFVSCWISAIQVIELMEFSAGAGIFDEEDGYEADDEVATTSTDSFDEGYEDETDGDF